jgi:16S rRNA (guanine966-N2)-methyltransferase
MRVIGGKYRGRRIDMPRTLSARPTTDFARESLFNILQHSEPLEEIRVLDLYAGSGAISLEFLSRGAATVVSVDHDAATFAHLQRVAKDFPDANWQQVRCDAVAFLRAQVRGFDIVFADPPFEMEGIEQLPGMVLDSGVLAEEGLFILEHPQHVHTEELAGFRRHRRYGTVHFSFFRPHAPTA